MLLKRTVSGNICYEYNKSTDTQWLYSVSLDVQWCYLSLIRSITRFHLAGMPLTSGLISRQDVVATVDCPAVAPLKRAGAIPLGVTNTSELCMWLESNNHLHGITNNPYDTERIAGGSSGERASHLKDSAENWMLLLTLVSSFIFWLIVGQSLSLGTTPQFVW